MRRLKVLTWQTHGSYLYYLTQAPHEFHVLSKPGRPPGYGGRSPNMPWGDNVHDMPVSEARHHQFDCIIFQDDEQYEKDQYEFLSASQRALPRIYIEHDPPRAHPTDTRHLIDTPDVLLVHVTPFNALMWDSGATPTCVIEHGVKVPEGVHYRGQLDCGLVVINHLARRGRRLGADLFEAARADVPLELVGMGAQELGGLGEIEHALLPAFAANYRYLFNPIRYTSLGLAVIEAMMIGMPVVALATTEMATVIVNGENGFIDTRLDTLLGHMRELGRNPALARALGAQARRRARERFAIGRFRDDWDRALCHVTELARAPFPGQPY
ncbi:glycosyltransferase [Massilia sp. CCM 8695]|uniref:Glycosyltransferase n=1 Tax=Massilia frigida TaxID=2609281 RepID=A0ABX0NIW9_9BURK|nr:glycosyltransferase [Massilia frigida]NHZ83879.1 glycosyltransferase [Massilia frigida]